MALTSLIFQAPVNLTEELLALYDSYPNVTITTDPDVPKHLWIDLFLFKLAFSNAFSNAQQHGKQEPTLTRFGFGLGLGLGANSDRDHNLHVNRNANCPANPHPTS